MLKNIPTATEFVDEWTHEWICHTDRSGQIAQSNWYSDANTAHYQMFDTVPQYVIDTANENALAKAVKAAELDGAARMLEKMEKVLLSELVNQSNESSISKAEHWARRHERFKAHITEMVEARTSANVARAEWEATQMRFEAWRTKEATTRAEMNLR